MEAKFVSYFEAKILVDNISKPLKNYCDNSATIFFSKNDKYCKHNELKYFVVKEEIQKSKASIEHINIDLMIIDPLTKGLLPKLFVPHVKNIVIMSTSEC